MRFTQTRTDVGTWAHAWERAIPFVPIFIVPYRSIDAFFALAPFPCPDRRDLTRLARRIVFGIVVAGLFFRFMPMRFVFKRPAVVRNAPLAGTAAVTVAFLLRARIVDTPDAAFASLKSKRPGMVIRPEVQACVEAFAARHTSR